jgi:hypothetical protein
MEFMDLFRPKWKHSNWKVRLAAVEKLLEQRELAEVATNDADTDVRRAAVVKLTDQVVLADIVKNQDLMDDIRKVALSKLTDQAILAEVIKNCNDYFGYTAVLDKLTDQNVLVDMAKNSENCFLVQQIARKLTDHSILTDIAKNANKKQEFMEAAVDKFIDQTTLAEIVKNTDKSSVAERAVNKLTDQFKLVDISQNARYIDVQIKATLKLEDLHLKVENLLRILNEILNESKKYSFVEDRIIEILNNLRILYWNKLLSSTDKNSILQLKGMEYKKQESWWVESGEGNYHSESETTTHHFEL